MHLLAATAAALAMLPPAPLPPAPPEPVSRALGKPFDGRLVGGVPLPEQGRSFFTWDWGLRRTPNREWRRYATTTTIARTLTVLQRFRAAHPEAPRIGVADLSRPQGGEFGRRFGGDGHASHQNGLDVDILYPRRDGLEKAPLRPSQVDRELSQALLDAFVRAGATDVFIGRRVGLVRKRRLVQAIPNHEDHLHVRWGR